MPAVTGVYCDWLARGAGVACDWLEEGVKLAIELDAVVVHLQNGQGAPSFKKKWENVLTTGQKAILR